MKIVDIIKILKGYLINMPSIIRVNKFTTDSRNVNKDDCFIAINTGSDYIDEAIKNKCSLVITEKQHYTNSSTGIFVVQNSVNALASIATYLREKYIKIPLIGITGSCGKTILKELLYDILSTKYNVLKTEKNYNNIIGVSNTLLKLDNNIDIILCELGTNNKGEINTLCNIVKPDVGVITNIYSSHIGNFKSKYEIYKEKINLLNNCNKKFINYNNKYLKKYKSNYKSNLKYKNTLYTNDRLVFDLVYNGIYKINFVIPNKKLIDSILLSIDICLYFNIDIETIVNCINNFKTIEGRMDITKSYFTLIDDCYNASYESINFDYLKTKKDLIIILGDIFELGKYTKYYHKKIDKKLKHFNCIKLLVGNYTKIIDGIHFNNNEEVLNYLKGIDLTNKTIYIKGSHKNNLKYLVDNLKGF